MSTNAIIITAVSLLVVAIVIIVYVVGPSIEHELGPERDRS